MTDETRTLLGAALGAAVGGAAWRARALSVSGAVAAAMVGAIAVAASWWLGAWLVVYFVTSTVISRLGSARKRARVSGMVEKSGPRDATQVLANGLPFAIAAGTAIALPDSMAPLLAVSSLAASAADTWATEVGTWIGGTPHSILTGRPLAVGESGGVTLPGWLGAGAGAAFMGTMVAVRYPAAFVIVTASGLVGATVDSILGATLQRSNWCEACGRSTEMDVHTCGTETRYLRGLRWLNNDAVNLIATSSGALFPLLVGGIARAAAA